MNFSELVTETALRGFTDLLDQGTQELRLKRWVNQAAREIYDIAPWPFLNAKVEDTPPLEIEDLGHVLSVSDLRSNEVLDPLDERQVTEFDPDRDETGAAIYWFRSDLTHIDVWPADASAQIVIRYVKQPVDMVELEDEPLIPATYHNLIVDGAVVRCYQDRDNFEAAGFVRQDWERALRGMKHALLKPNYDRNRTVVRTGLAIDYR